MDLIDLSALNLMCLPSNGLAMSIPTVNFLDMATMDWTAIGLDLSL